MKQLLLIAVMVPLLLFGQQPTREYNTYVNDNAHVLAPFQELHLNTIIRELETNTTVQLAVIILDTLPPNVQIDGYAREFGRQFHVGNNYNGIVYVVSLRDHKQRLEIGEHLEGDIGDVQAKTILEGMKAHLKAKHYTEAVELLVSQVTALIDIKAAALPVHKESKNGLWLVLTIIALFTLLGLAVAAIVRRRKRKEFHPYNDLSQADFAHVPPPLPHPSKGGTGEYKRGRNRWDGKLTDDRPSTSFIPVVVSSPEPANVSESSSDFGNFGSSDNSSSQSNGFEGAGATTDF